MNPVETRAAISAAILLFGVPASTASLADVIISSAATKNIICANGVCTPTARDAVLNAGDLQSLLASGNVEVTTTGSAVQATNIRIDASFSWSTSSVLALDAYESIRVEKPVANSGPGGLTITTNDGGSGGTLWFAPKGNITFADPASVLMINTTSYTLLTTLPALANAIAANPFGAYALANGYNAGQDGVYQSCPIATPFKGQFEGLGNSILDLAINDPVDASVGLFALLESGAIRDVRVMHAKITATASAVVGALSAFNDKGIVSGSQSSGAVSATGWYSDVGGLVGVSGGGHKGNRGEIVDSSSAAIVTGGFEASAGGLVGGAGDLILRSRATGSVSAGTDGFAGGLVGQSGGLSLIEQSYATGTVTVGNWDGAAQWNPGVGGLVGLGFGRMTNSYATGDVSGGQQTNVGGLVGQSSRRSSASTYSIGAPTGGAGSFVGGVVGSGLGRGYWDTTTSRTNKGIGGKNVRQIVGLTSKELRSGLPLDFDPAIWAEKKSLNRGFPYLIANPPQ
ncbi:MAG TPA: GLUG motif-containing protein [Rhizomicrobium sp.]|nr:GLUG motif-containing protein [Rhizomicrobium sp.]